jgi:hypothetical protein
LKALAKAVFSGSKVRCVKVKKNLQKTLHDLKVWQLFVQKLAFLVQKLLYNLTF